jgi:chromosome segregation ATPase
MVDQQVLTEAISVVGAIIVTYLGVKYKDYIIVGNRNKAPKDRMDTIFDGYEGLIKQQQSDIDRKSRQLDQTQVIIERLQHELDETKKIVQQQRQELDDSKEANKQLIQQLAHMKAQYGDKVVK